MDVTKTCRDIKQLNSLAQKACNLFLEECKKQGVHIFITETFRSQERQNWLYEQGRTRAGIKVTWTKQSNHTGRMAWDIACSPPQQLYDARVLAKAGVIAKKLGITWGGVWHSPDAPHFEITSKWVAPKVEDTELVNATNKLSVAGINFNVCNWNSVERMDMKYAQTLIERMGQHFGKHNYFDTIDFLVAKKVITDRELWDKKIFKAEYVRVILIRVAALL